MGKGDKRSRKGKIFKGSFGNSRPHKLKKKHSAPVAAPSGVAGKSAEPVKKAARSKKKKEGESAPAE